MIGWFYLAPEDNGYALGYIFSRVCDDLYLCRSKDAAGVMVGRLIPIERMKGWLFFGNPQAAYDYINGKSDHKPEGSGGTG